MPEGDVLLLLDEEGRVTEWGPAAKRLFGWSALEAVGRPMTALLHRAAANDGPQRDGLPDTTALVVKPALRGRSVVWQVLAAGGRRAPRDTAVLTALFTHPGVELQVYDDQLRAVRVSAPDGELSSTPAAHVVGMPFPQACGCAFPQEEAAVARGVLATGEPALNRFVPSAETSARLGRRIRSVSYFRLEDPGGAVAGLLACATDVTEQERARKSLALLETVRTGMGHRMNVMDACQELVDAVVPAFADAAVVEMVEGVVRGEDPPLAPVDPDVLLCQGAVHGRIALPPEAVRALPAGAVYARVLAALQPRLVLLGKGSTPPADDSAGAPSAGEDDDCSLIVAPLVLGDRILGLASFYRHGHDDTFAGDDLAVTSAVCAHAALCIDRASLFMREWIVMSTVQRRLLPGQLTDQPTVQICTLHIPGAEGGGAWCDTIALPGARTALVVGDIAGQGIPAAITMGLLRTAIHTLAALDLQPDELLARLSDTAARLVSARAALPPLDPLAREPLTAGCTVAIYDPVDLTCTVACGGLREPVAIFPDGTSSTLPVPPGPALAAPDTAPFPAATVRLPAGSTLALGTAELADQVLAPSGPLRPLLRRAAASTLPDLRDTIEQAYLRGDRPNETLLLLARAQALPDDRVMTQSLPAGPEAAPIARRAARRQLAAWAVDDETAYTTELIVGELVGNATRYGTAPLQLRLILDRMLTCEVSDAAPSAPHVQHARTVDESGRGLFIIASLAEQWGTRYTVDGKIVWAEQPTGTTLVTL
ncbi:SpoIIE family protein phosphatase [Streptomyces sp. NPDC007157]|uniref:SpoIIE family protein phosphatase n=1 Tax=Streptomyces sp. NPDC007157 TaxID=3154681 RepID=UPI0034118FC0